MSMFGQTSGSDPVFSQRLAELEAQQGLLQQAVADQTAALQEALSALAEERSAGDRASLDALQDEVSGRALMGQAIDDRVGTEVVVRSKQIEVTNQRIDGLLDDAVEQSVGAATQAVMPVAATVNAYRLETQAARDAAQAAAITAMLGNIYATAEAGLLATADGDDFVSYGPAGAYATRYRNVAGAAVAIDAYPSKSALEQERADRLELLREDSQSTPLILTDEDGYAHSEVHPDGIELPDLSMRLSSHYGLSPIYGAIDGDGYVVETLSPDGFANGIMSSAAANTDTIAGYIDPDGYIVEIVDPNGAVAGLLHAANLGLPDVVLGWIDRDGYFVPLATADGAIAGFYDASALGLVDVIFGAIDGDGYLIDLASGSGSSPVDDDGDEALYGARNAANLAASTALKSRTIAPDIAGFFWDFSLAVQYGQSLAVGNETHPRLSKVQTLSNVMVGGAVRSGASPTNADFSPVGGASFQPHVAVVQNASTRAILSDVQVALLSYNDAAFGETYQEGAANGFKKLWNAHRGFLDDTSRILVSAVSGLGSKTISELGSDGAFWRELTTHCGAVRTLAVAAGKSSGVMAMDYAQGENDYTPAATSEAAWRTTFLTKVFEPFVQDVAVDGFSQSTRPAFFLYGISPNARRDANGTSQLLSIDMAQVGLARDYDNIFIVGPNYHVPDKGVHLTSNGARWMGNMGAKVRHRVLTERRHWRHLEPRWEAAGGPFKLAGDILSIDFFVPEPPLAWFQPYVGRTATDFTGKGFNLRDATGPIAFTIRLALDTIVELKLARVPTGTLWISYAAQLDHAGHGCLRDSDPFISPDFYEYDPASGQAVDENIPELVGKPYPNFNPCVPFRGSIQL